MANKHRFTANEVADALTQTKGMLFLAAKLLGCHPETIRNYCRRYPHVQAVKETERGEMVDMAELKLRQSIQNGEAWGIAFCLKTIGKDRGYVERQEVTGADGPVQIEVVYTVASQRDLTASPQQSKPQAIDVQYEKVRIEKNSVG